VDLADKIKWKLITKDQLMRQKYRPYLIAAHETHVVGWTGIRPGHGGLDQDFKTGLRHGERSL
jgi:hypothetical protein